MLQAAVDLMRLLGVGGLGRDECLARQGTEADTAQGRLDEIKRDQEVLGAFYQHFLAPVEAHLAGATEVLIIPHKELFEVPWAALFDRETGQYLIQRFVLRVAPSLRVARTTADALRVMNGPEEKMRAGGGQPAACSCTVFAQGKSRSQIRSKAAEQRRL